MEPRHRPPVRRVAISLPTGAFRISLLSTDPAGLGASTTLVHSAARASRRTTAPAALTTRCGVPSFGRAACALCAVAHEARGSLRWEARTAVTRASRLAARSTTP